MEPKPEKKPDTAPAKAESASKEAHGSGDDPGMKTAVIPAEKLDRLTAPAARDGKASSSTPKPGADSAAKTLVLPPEKLDRPVAPPGLESPAKPASDTHSQSPADPGMRTLVLSPEKLDRLAESAAKEKSHEAPKAPSKSDARDSKPPASDPKQNLPKIPEDPGMKTMVLPPEKLEKVETPSSKEKDSPKPPTTEAMKTGTGGDAAPSVSKDAVAGKQSEAKPGAAGRAERAPRPIPWPLLLILLMVAGVGSMLGYQWTTREPIFLRTAWICLCSIVPGLSAMAVIGSLAQFRRRPILSTLSLLLGVAMLGGCWWGYQVIAENAPLYLR